MLSLQKLLQRKPPQGHPNLDVFLSQIENDLFKTIEKFQSFSRRLRSCEDFGTLANDHDVVIKKADKDSRVIWERNDYIQQQKVKFKMN